MGASASICIPPLPYKRYPRAGGDSKHQFQSGVIIT